MRTLVIALAVIFGLLSAAPNLQGGQFLNVGKIVEHYNNHQSTDESFSSFISFLKDHYFENHPTKNNEKHLPFKSSVAGVPIIVLQQLAPTEINHHFPIGLNQKSCFGEPNHFVQNRTITIWNPPRMC